MQLGLETDGSIAADCSSSLVAENLILTARHCVGDVDAAKERVLNTYDPDRLVVYAGSDGPQQLAAQSTPAARGKQILVPDGDSLFPDIAFIVLDRAVDAPIAHLRLNGVPKKSEKVNVVGFGMNEESANVSVRMQRQAVKITALAPAVTSFHELHAGEFAFGEAACFGDSGGPALSATTNAIVGVASRVNSGVAGTADQPNRICVGAEGVYTGLRPFKALVDQAFAAAGATPLVEDGDDEVGDRAASSTKTTKSATHDEDDTTHNPTGAAPAAGGCSTSSSSSTSSFGALALGLAVVLVARRRRKRRANGAAASALSEVLAPSEALTCYKHRAVSTRDHLDEG